MNRKNPLKNVLLIGCVIIVASLGYWYWNKSQPGQLDQFATCLGQKSVKFYGAFWCPHCQAQKTLFGNSKDKLPYIECSNPDGQSQTQICKDKNIQSYPTWSFMVATGTGATATVTETFEPGEHTLSQLSEKSGCVLPSGVK